MIANAILWLFNGFVRLLEYPVPEKPRLRHDRGWYSEKAYYFLDDKNFYFQDRLMSILTLDLGRISFYKKREKLLRSSPPSVPGLFRLGGASYSMNFADFMDYATLAELTRLYETDWGRRMRQTEARRVIFSAGLADRTASTHAGKLVEMMLKDQDHDAWNNTEWYVELDQEAAMDWLWRNTPYLLDKLRQ